MVLVLAENTIADRLEQSLFLILKVAIPSELSHASQSLGANARIRVAEILPQLIEQRYHHFGGQRPRWYGLCKFARNERAESAALMFFPQESPTSI